MFYTNEMGRITVVILVVVLQMFAQQKSFAQQVVYTFNNGVFLSENEIKTGFETLKRSLPSSLILTPIIYHKTVKKDTIVNYVSFSVNKSDPMQQPLGFELIYKQDSTFLLLNKKLPAFKLNTLEGIEVSSAQLMGKPTLINFWATYCGPCIAEMPHLSQLKEKYKDKMNFISITENRAIQDNLATFLKDKNFSFPVLENGQAYKNELKLNALPRNLFLDQDGMLRFIQVNYPINENSIPLDINDKANYFTKIIEQLIK